MSHTVQAQMQTKYKRDVIYDEDDHLGVMFQLYGSVWPKVLPWCIAVMTITYLFIYLRNHGIVDLTIADNTGHNFMSILVSFLVVTRVRKLLVFERFQTKNICRFVFSLTLFGFKSPNFANTNRSRLRTIDSWKPVTI